MKQDWRSAVLLRLILVVFAVRLYVLLQVLARYGITGQPTARPSAPITSTGQENL